MSAGALPVQLEALDRRLGDGVAARAARAAALARFEALGYPGRSLETWHYTDLGTLARRELSFVPAAPGPELLERAEAWLAESGIDPAASRCVFIDGHPIASLSQWAGVTGVLPNMAGAAAHGPADGAGDSRDTALADLNEAFAAYRTVIRIGPEDPAGIIHLICLSGSVGFATQLRVTIELAAAARGSVIQHFAELPGAGESWLNLVSDIRLDAGAELELHRLQAHDPGQVHTALTRAHLGPDARLLAGNLEIGGKLVRNELLVQLAGERAHADLFGLAIGESKQHIDNRWAVDHRAPRTNSRQEYRAIVADASRSVFNGKVTVRQDAQQIDARQRNDNLLLSPRAEADTKPELEIYADQVACSHGATVGELSEDHLFYLRARGIDESAARSMLTTAFAARIAHRFAPDSLRERADAMIERRLATIAARREAAS